MKSMTSASLGLMFGMSMFGMLSTSPILAQTCTALPAVPDSTITTTQDRDQMMCQQNLTFPTLPVRQGTAWPWNDPTAPTNAWPTSLTNPEGNWTDAQGHVVIRTMWGNWHTYDAEKQFEPDPSLHYPLIPPARNGGAMSGFGDFGPFSWPRYTDIELLRMKDGERVRSREDWWIKRRPEIFKLLQHEIYGDTLANFLPKITWTVVPGNPATGTVVGSDGNSYAYSRKIITGTVDISSYPALRHAPRITATCQVPIDKVGKKTPVVVTYGESDFSFTAPYGIAMCSYNPTAVQPDSGGANLSDYVIGLKNQGNWRKPDDPGSLVIWGWGVSRLIDYFATDADFDSDKVAVEGHSRYGKSTLVAGAYDDRIAVTWPSDAGQMGTALARRSYGETLDFIASTTGEYHWLAGGAMNYAGRPFPKLQFPRRAELLDVDAHSTESLIAPRAIFISNGTDTPAGVGDAWADPRGCFLSGYLASPVWDFLGWDGLVIPRGTPFTTDAGYTPPAGCTQCSMAAESIGGTPAFDTALIEGTVAWRRQKEGHTPVPNWPSFMQFASRYLNDGRPVVAPNQAFTVYKNHGIVGTVKASDPDLGDRSGRISFEDFPVHYFELFDCTTCHSRAMRPSLRSLQTLSILLSAFSTALVAQTPVAPRLQTGFNAIRESNLRTNLTFIAGDGLSGRMSLQPGDDAAAGWVVSEFAKAGLQPAATDTSGKPSFLQAVPLIEYKPDPSATSLSLSRKVGTPQQWHAPAVTCAFRDNVDASGGLVYVGYGITAPELNYDDYANVDVRGKIVLLMEHEPREDDPKSIFNGTGNTRYATSRVKLLNAQRHGAIAVLLMQEPNATHVPTSKRLANVLAGVTTKRLTPIPLQAIANDEVSIALMTISPAVSDELLQNSGVTAKDLQSSIDRDLKSHSREIAGVQLHLQTKNISTRAATTYNVAGLLPGSDPALAAETLIVSGHHDHNGASEVEEQNGQRHLDIWHGADDNGSGTVGVVELAHAFAANPAKPKRSILFVVFASEERGLLGSYYMAQHPLRPLATTRAMVNFDMIGRDEKPSTQTDGVIEIPADTTNRLNLVGTLYSPDFLHTVQHEDEHIGLTLDDRFERDTALGIFFRSDQFPFILHDVPALWFFTGFHPDYHHITDTVEKIDFTKMTKITRLSYLTLFAIADEKQTPKFVANPALGK